MAKCIIPSCGRTGSDLFCAPDDNAKLKKWKSIIKTEENNFLICSLHFEPKFIGKELFLLQNAYPSILINLKDEYTEESLASCRACLEKFDSDVKHPIDDKIKEIFKSATHFEVNFE